MSHWAVIGDNKRQHLWTSSRDGHSQSCCGYTYWNSRLMTPKDQSKCRICEKQSATPGDN